MLVTAATAMCGRKIGAHHDITHGSSHLISNFLVHKWSIHLSLVAIAVIAVGQWQGLWVPAIWYRTSVGDGLSRVRWTLTARWNGSNDYSVFKLMFFGDLVQLTTAPTQLRWRMSFSVKDSDMLDPRRDRYHMHSKGQLANPSTSTKSYRAPWE